MIEKHVCQLDAEGYFVGMTVAEASPLEPGVYLLPGGSIDVEAPAIPNGKRARWANEWVIEDIPTPEIQPSPETEQLAVSQAVTIRQAKLALLQAGLLDDVEAAMAQADRATQIEWEYAREFRRDWTALVAMQPALGLSDAQVDDLFRLAATL